MFIIQISELLLKNNNEEVSLDIQKEKQILFDSFTWGFHAYMKIRTSKVEDSSLYLKWENGNKHNRYAVALMTGR